MKNILRSLVITAVIVLALSVAKTVTASTMPTFVPGDKLKHDCKKAGGDYIKKGKKGQECYIVENLEDGVVKTTYSGWYILPEITFASAYIKYDYPNGDVITTEGWVYTPNGWKQIM